MTKFFLHLSHQTSQKNTRHIYPTIFDRGILLRDWIRARKADEKLRGLYDLYLIMIILKPSLGHLGGSDMFRVLVSVFQSLLIMPVSTITILLPAEHYRVFRAILLNLTLALVFRLILFLHLGRLPYPTLLNAMCWAFKAGPARRVTKGFVPS